MASKYQILWKDADGDSFQVDISNAAYGGSTNQLTGSGTITEDGGSIWQPVRSRFLTLKILVTTNTKTLIDGLFTEEDRYWTVRCLKEGQEIFLGSLSIEPVEQPFNSDVWEIQIECRDALGFLEDLAFVQDSGLVWTGKKTIVEIIALAVRRGFGEVAYATTKEFRVASNITMIGLPGTLPFQEYAYVEMDAFLDDNDEPQSCLEVLEAMLEAMGCTIFQYQDRWAIINIELWAQLATGPVNYRRYSGTDGSYIGAAQWGIASTYRDIGTQTDGNAVFHVNENASYFYDKYLQFSRLKHVYEIKDQILPNGELLTEGAGPYTLAKWTLDATHTDIGPDQLFVDQSTSTGFLIVATSTAIKLSKDLVLQMDISILYTVDPIWWFIGIKVVGATETWWYAKYTTASEGIWLEQTGAPSTGFYFYFGPNNEGVVTGPFNHRIDIPNVPVDGDLTIYIGQVNSGTATVTTGAIIEYIEISVPSSVQEGREFTAERTDKSTGRVAEVEEIRFCTADTAIIKNTFFTSADLLINFVYYGGVLSEVYLLEALALARLRLEKGRLYQFSGEMKGPIEHLTPKTINSLDDGIFLIGRMDLDLTTGISSNTFLGVNITDAGATYDSENRIVYKDSIKPKIK